MTQEKIQRINELYRKSQAEGLSEAEKKEQDLLRKEYIANVKKNLRNQLNNIDMVNDDGSVENLGEKYGNKKRRNRKKHGYRKYLCPKERPDLYTPTDRKRKSGFISKSCHGCTDSSKQAALGFRGSG